MTFLLEKNMKKSLKMATKIDQKLYQNPSKNVTKKQQKNVPKKSPLGANRWVQERLAETLGRLGKGKGWGKPNPFPRKGLQAKFLTNF